jgi:isopenicillin-N epimerase
MSSTSSPPTSLFTPKGYQGFASFHNDVSVEELVRQPDGVYASPPRPVDCSDLLPPSPTPFGVPFRAAHFFVDPSWTFVNHGAFGGACRAAMTSSRRWAEYAETQPLRFIDRELFALLVDSVRDVSQRLLGGPAPELVALVPNATYALTSIIASFPLSRGQTVYMLDIGYGSVGKMLRRRCEEVGATVVTGVVGFPTTRERLVRDAVEGVPVDCALAVVDHIASNTGILLPLAEIVAGIRRRAPACRILVDGAHGLASQELDLRALRPDYYVTNCHKWLCSGKGLALLYVDTPELAAQTRAAVISHGFGAGFSSEFAWDGCRDYSMAVALPTLLRWWDTAAPGGLAGARDYCRGLLREAVEVLCAAWGTGTHVTLDLYSHMACVELPPSCLPPGAVVRDHETGEVTAYRSTSTHGKMLQDALHFGFKVECPVKTLVGPERNEPRSYVRISAMVYNAREDFERLAEAVLAIRWKEDGRLDEEAAAAVSGRWGR